MIFDLPLTFGNSPPEDKKGRLSASAMRIKWNKTDTVRRSMNVFKYREIGQFLNFFFPLKCFFFKYHYYFEIKL